VNEEIFKILLFSPLPSVGLEELFKLGAISQLFQELYSLTLSIQDPLFHPEKDQYGNHTVWYHTKLTVDQAKRLSDLAQLSQEKKLALLLASLYHDVGKPSTSQWEFKKGRMVITNNGHDVLSEKITKKILSRFRIFSWNGYKIRKTVLSLIKCHHRASELWQNREIVTKKAFNRLAADISGEIELLVYLDAADRAGRKEKPITELDEEARWLLRKFKELNVTKETIKPLIMGRDLIKMAVAPGPLMGKILKKLYELQLDNEFETKKEGLQIAKKIIEKELR
jgi:tRNA nucleotidyltransferase (CCA-adding enzyme)